MLKMFEDQFINPIQEEGDDEMNPQPLVVPRSQKISIQFKEDTETQQQQPKSLMQ